MQTKRRVVAGKIEGVEGTAETLTATETGLVCIDPKYTADIKMLPRGVVLATFSKYPDLSGQQLAHINIKAEVIGRGSAYAANNLPVLSPYLKACGLAETIDVTAGSEKVTYKRASSGIPSLTLGLYTDGLIKKICGARGTLKLTGNVGEPLYAEMDFIGVYIDPIDGAMLTPTYGNINPPQLLNATFTTGGVSPALKSFSIDLGNKLEQRDNMNAASGIQSFALTDGDTRGQFDPESVLVATNDYYGKWKAGLTGALNIGPFGPTQYDKIQIAGAKQRTTKIAEGTRNGVDVLTVDFQLAMTSGDDEFSLVFS
jgi:hypothetical protein